jgi:hypothetical protein
MISVIGTDVGPDVGVIGADVNVGGGVAVTGLGAAADTEIVVAVTAVVAVSVDNGGAAGGAQAVRVMVRTKISALAILSIIV